MRDVLLRRGPARTLALLGVVTLLMVALAVFAVSMQRRALTSDFEPRLMFPELGGQVNDVSRIEIVSRLSQVTVERDQQATDSDVAVWRLLEKGGHPVRAEMVKRTAVGLADLELIEQRTAQPEWHQHINLTNPADKGTGVRVTLFGADGGEVASLIVGKLEGTADIDGEGTIYVRRTAEDQSYVARGSFNLEQNAAAWLDTGVIDLAAGRVARVEVSPPEGESYVVERVAATSAETPTYQISNLADDLQPVTDYAINGIGNALVNLQFTDVQPIGDVEFDAPTRTVFSTDDGLRITVEAQRLSGGYFAVLSAGAAVDADEAVRREAAVLGARLAPYAYGLSTPKGADLTRSFDTLTEPKSADGAVVDLEALEDAARAE